MASPMENSSPSGTECGWCEVALEAGSGSCDEGGGGELWRDLSAELPVDGCRQSKTLSISLSSHGTHVSSSLSQSDTLCVRITIGASRGLQHV